MCIVFLFLLLYLLCLGFELEAGIVLYIRPASQPAKLTQITARHLRASEQDWLASKLQAEAEATGDSGRSVEPHRLFFLFGLPIPG